MVHKTSSETAVTQIDKPDSPVIMDEQASGRLLTPEELDEARQALDKLLDGLGTAILGQRELLELVVICLLARGHMLLEGLPGLGKTELVKSLSALLGLQFRRVQFTPDLLPSDITGAPILEEHQGSRKLVFHRGPIFANLVLADEINRATPKTQSALLEAMQERRVTVLGESHVLPAPFFVLATQNPIELEGTSKHRSTGSRSRSTSKACRATRCSRSSQRADTASRRNWTSCGRPMNWSDCSN